MPFISSTVEGGGYFTTADGRRVRVVFLELSWIWDGVLEGSKERVAEFFITQLHGKIARRYGDHVPVCLGEELVSPEHWIDKEWMIHFKLEGASLDERRSGSHMAACILTKEFPADLGEVLREVIGQITWERDAEDYEL